MHQPESWQKSVGAEVYLEIHVLCGQHRIILISSTFWFWKMKYIWEKTNSIWRLALESRRSMYKIIKVWITTWQSWWYWHNRGNTLNELQSLFLCKSHFQCQKLEYKNDYFPPRSSFQLTDCSNFEVDPSMVNTIPMISGLLKNQILFNRFLKKTYKEHKFRRNFMIQFYGNCNGLFIEIYPYMLPNSLICF